MPRTITDTKTFMVQVIEHGFAQILNVVIPASVERDKPFDIAYDCKNTGPTTDTLYGLLYQDDVPLSGSDWSETIQPDETKHKLYHHPGIQNSATIKIETGHE